jgi:glycosyltransferase involved in cell wall biosynthesis
VAWDIPLTEGYEYEEVPNTARQAGTDHFWGLQNPSLASRVRAWDADAVHITGYAYASHLSAIRSFHRDRVPVLFRGDSHLIGRRLGIRWRLKRILLARVFKWVAGCLYVGKNNYDYFRELGVPDSRLFYCPHGIEVERFAEPDDKLEERARYWRHEIQIPENARTLLFAGKFQRGKRTVELMKAVARIEDPNVVLIMVGNGELEPEIRQMAAQLPQRFRVLPFQNQSLMPVVYRLGDIFTLPSAGETWGLGVNEAMACERRVLISDKVGCAPDVVTSIDMGEVFTSFDSSDFTRKLHSLFEARSDPDRIRDTAFRFDVAVTERTLCEALHRIVG